VLVLVPVLDGLRYERNALSRLPLPVLWVWLSSQASMEICSACGHKFLNLNAE
jgi:hypothetical protein